MLQQLADNYNRKIGQPSPVKDIYPKVSVTQAVDIAKAYDSLPVDDSANPAVKKAYEALAKEVDEQYRYATEQLGVKFVPWK